MREIARAIGWEASKYQYYEDKYRKRYLPLEFVEMIRPHLVGRGEPPIMKEELDALLPPYARKEDASPPTFVKARVKDLAWRGKTLGGLAKAMGVDNSRISEIIKGERQVKVSELSAMSIYLEMSITDLVVALTSRP